jgi:hypothetical protein
VIAFLRFLRRSSEALLHPQVWRRMRSISATATPQTCAAWATVMPYFTHDRMRANCERRISRAGGAGAIGVSSSSGKTGAGGGIIGSTRGLCAVASTPPDGALTRACDVNNASAVRRAFVIRS